MSNTAVSGSSQAIIANPYGNSYTLTLPSHQMNVGGAGGTYAYAVKYVDEAGVEVKYGAQSSRKRISPKLYFSYVKSKLNKTQTKKLKSRLQKLQSLVKNADALGQEALYQEFSKMLIVAVRESEAVACGYDVFVNRTDVNKFMGLVSENDESTRNPIRFSKLEDFPRAVPAKIQKKIQDIKSKNLFDEMWILYLDYTGEKLKTNKEKIREKDPVLFGKFNYDDNRFYFIADWIDEYCDLTLSSFVDKLKADDEEYEVSKADDMTPEYLERIKSEIKEREERLTNTRPGNYRGLMDEEDLAKKEKELEAKYQEQRAADRAKWREEANQELKQMLEEKDKELSAKKPWWKKIF